LERIVKIFIMISEITVENGAFRYVRGSQLGGRLGDLEAPFILERTGAKRTLDEQMAEVVSESEWVTVVGAPDTIIVADTSGFHKGGFVYRGRRLLFKALFGDWLCTLGPMVRIEDLGDLLDGRAARWAASWR